MAKYPTPSPGVNPAPGAKEFRRSLPARVVRAEVSGIVDDIYAIVQREVARFKALKGMSPQDIRALSELARTTKEVRQLEALAEDELGEVLAKESDSELEERLRKP